MFRVQYKNGAFECAETVGQERLLEIIKEFGKDQDIKVRMKGL